MKCTVNSGKNQVLRINIESEYLARGVRGCQAPAKILRAVFHAPRKPRKIARQQQKSNTVTRCG
jgi:hypothetical protein